MKRILVLVLVRVMVVPVAWAQTVQLELENVAPGDFRVAFTPPTTSIPYAAVSRTFVLEHSENLREWESLHELSLENAYAYQAGLGVPEGLLEGPQRYFRMRMETTVRYTTDNAADYLGLETPFTAALISRFYPEGRDLLVDYPERTYAGEHPWDVTTAAYWDLFATDPAVHNVDQDPEEDGWRAVDYRLNEEEMAIFRREGFVVSERLGTDTFGDAFYDLWTDDLPVFISTDAMLHAWHRSFQSSLEEIDALVMAQELRTMLEELSEGLEAHRDLYASGDPFLQMAFEDVDGFFQVARSLLDGSLSHPSFADGSWVGHTVSRAMDARDVIGWTDLFGQLRIVDYTQFEPRGHYTKTEQLKRYFRAMMWCFRIDFRLTPAIQFREDPEEIASALRQVGAAALLAQLIVDQGLEERWAQMENVLAAVGGYGDAMTPPQFKEILEAADALDVGSIGSEEEAIELQRQLLEGTLGVQNIRSHAILSPRNTQQQAVLSRSFTFFSQRFVLDSWAMSKVVFDSIIFDENGIPEETDKIFRRIPSGLDVAFTAFANNAALPILVDRMEDPLGRAYRDGYPYQNNLAAVRAVLDDQPEEAWMGNVYHHWLRTLRGLSHLPQEETLPHCMRTEAWARKDLNTQLASWTQLRHDTILYAKQSATALTICSFPDGYVEPRPRVWARLREMAGAMQAVVEALPAEGEIEIETEIFPGFTETTTIDVVTWKEAMSGFYARFAARVVTLETLVAKQLRHEPFTDEDLTFIDGLIQSGGTVGSGGERRYDGWYPELFYQRLEDVADNAAGEFDALVTDVHTDFPDAISDDPGTILHEAVGGIPFMLVAVEREDGRRAVYGGPVLSHYEFDTGPELIRLTDEAWRDRLFQGEIPVPHDWTRDYLVPAEGGIPLPSGSDF